MPHTGGSVQTVSVVSKTLVAAPSNGHPYKVVLVALTVTVLQGKGRLYFLVLGNPVRVKGIASMSVVTPGLSISTRST